MNKLKIFSLILSIVCIFLLCGCNQKDKTPDYSLDETKKPEIFVNTEEVQGENIEGYEEKDAKNSQVGIIVDSWLKVISLGETNGKLSVLVRNIADFDVQYAVLSVVCEDKTLTFSMSTITAGSNAILVCDTNEKFKEDTPYYSWGITDKVVFTEKMSLYPDVFEIDGTDGFISVKNISNKKIKGNIYVYFKTVVDGVYAEGTTYRVCIDGLDKGEKIQISADHFKKDSSKVMFVTYVQ